MEAARESFQQAKVAPLDKRWLEFRRQQEFSKKFCLVCTYICTVSMPHIRESTDVATSTYARYN